MRPSKEAIFAPKGNALSLRYSQRLECWIYVVGSSFICHFCKECKSLFFQNYISLLRRLISISTAGNLTSLWAVANTFPLSYPSFTASFKDLFGFCAWLPLPSSSHKDQVLLIFFLILHPHHSVFAQLSFLSHIKNKTKCQNKGKYISPRS